LNWTCLLTRFTRSTGEIFTKINIVSAKRIINNAPSTEIYFPKIYGYTMGSDHNKYMEKFCQNFEIMFVCTKHTNWNTSKKKLLYYSQNHWRINFCISCNKKPHFIVTHTHKPNLIFILIWPEKTQYCIWKMMSFYMWNWI
jgi:hypothetical protein